MLKKSILLASIILAAVALAVGVSATTSHAQEGTTGDANFVFVNYIGREMTFDLDDTTYTIPGTDTMPQGGRLELQIPPGEHKYAANVPGIGTGSAGEFTLMPGQVVAKAARLEQTGPSVDNNGILLAKPDEYVFVFDFDPFAVPVEAAPVEDTWQPSVATAGQTSLVWINHLGDELTVDLNGQLYKVPPSANNIPGRLQVEADPGQYTYTASVPNGSVNGELTAVAGNVVGLTVYADPLPERDYEIGEEYEFVRSLDVHLVEEDLTTQAAQAAAQPAAQEEAAPATLPTTGGPLNSAPVDVPVTTDGLLIKNYAGDTLIFTINNQTYTIPNNAEQTLTLPPGHYTYTASIPFVATTGQVNLQAGQSIELSIAINVAHDVLSVYQN